MTSDFVRRAGFTLGALLIYRLGCNIPLPGLNFEALEQIFQAQVLHGVSGFLMPLTGLSRLAIFALGITPYISAAVLLQLGGLIFSRLRLLKSQGDRGRQTLRKLTFGLTIGLSLFQAYGIARALEQMNGIVDNPGGLFVLSTVTSLTGGTIFLAWLSEQITLFGLGNGIALILLAGTAAALRNPIVTAVEFNQRGLLSNDALQGLLLTVVLVIGAVVVIEQARRRFPVDYSKRQIGDRMFENLSSSLEAKLNPAGIIPAILASWLVSIVILCLGLIARLDPHWSTLVDTQLAVGRPVYLALYEILIFGCTFFYTAYVFDPEEVAARLQQHGGTIRSITPGNDTITYLDHALSRTVVIGAAYFTAVCLLPELLTLYMRIPFYFGGLSLLILVCTVLDFDHQIRGYLRFSGIARRP